jgi:excisionase family DNA binding protein
MRALGTSNRETGAIIRSLPAAAEPQPRPRASLTSTEAASLFAVHPSTVKRWCNEGNLPSRLTPGGHRRIRIDDAAGFARARGIPTLLAPFHPFESHVWTALRAIETTGSHGALHALALQWVRSGDFERLERLYLALGRADFLSFADLCDHAIRGLLAQVGDEWQKGRMRVGDEHMVTQAITGALHGLRHEFLQERAALRRSGSTLSASPQPVAVVGTPEGNHHAIGALCIRLLLERTGWTVFYPGPDVPIEDFGVIQMSREADLVCISLPPGFGLGDVTRCLSSLAARYDRARPYSVAFGGSTGLELEREISPGPFKSVAFYRDCASLLTALERGSTTRGQIPS